MKITDWIKGLLRDGKPGPGYRELQELSEKSETCRRCVQSRGTDEIDSPI